MSTRSGRCSIASSTARFAGRRLEGAVARSLEHVAEQLHVPLVVLHHEDLRARHRSTALSGQREHERASLADLAVAPDPAAVHLDEALRQREPETGPFVLPGTGVGLLELLEDPVEILGGDARAGIGDGDPHLAVRLRRGDVDQPARAA